MRSSWRAAPLALALFFSASAVRAQQPDPNAPPVAPEQPPDPPPATPPPTPPATPPADPWGGMNAGGTPPPPPASTVDSKALLPPSTSVDDDLAESKSKDSGRGLSWFWLEVEGGFEHVGLQTFNIDEANFSAGLVQTEASGGVLSGGVGAQILFFQIGVRARMGFFDAWQAGRIGGEIGFRIPLGFIEPRLDLGGGYVAFGDFDGVVAQNIGIHGAYARAGAGVDFYPIKWVSLGAHATFDFMALTRPGLDPTQIQQIADDPSIDDLSTAQQQALALEGSGYGATFAIQGAIGLHF